MKNLKMSCCIGMLAAAVFLIAGSAHGELLAYFPFNNSPNDVVHGFTSTVHGAPTYVGGVFGDAISFDGIDDYLEVIDDPSNDVLEAIDGAAPDVWGTVMCWVRTTDTSSTNSYDAPTFVERRQPSTFTVLYHLQLGADGYFVNFNIPPQHSTVADDEAGGTEAPVINDGEWHHIATTVKRSADESTSYLYLFVDGYQRGFYELGATSDFSGCEDLHIGARQKNTGAATSFVDAEMDELAIYSEWMNGEQIREIMLHGVPEPSTSVLLLGLGGAFVALVIRRR
ncbi:MAG: PEP-CTERM sorting domain-containing protein [Pirellulales bacterium]|nr:PEP-CTERM sorting domain-containing protein [Pirellulales bacterium]